MKVDHCRINMTKIRKGGLLITFADFLEDYQKKNHINKVGNFQLLNQPQNCDITMKIID